MIHIPKPIAINNMRIQEDDRRSSFYDIFGGLSPGQINISYSRDTTTVVGWHAHEETDEHWFCIKGAFKVGIRPVEEDTTNPKVQWVYLTDRNHQLLNVPPGFWHGWKAIEPGSILIYHISPKYDDTDCIRTLPGEFGECWETQNK